MPTGYEVQQYRDIERIRKSAESMTQSLEKIAAAMEQWLPYLRTISAELSALRRQREGQ